MKRPCPRTGCHPSWVLEVGHGVKLTTSLLRNSADGPIELQELKWKLVADYSPPPLLAPCARIMATAVVVAALDVI